jgi:hypothetical protein
MTLQLEEFVHAALDAMDAKRMQIGTASGVWRAELSESAARFLGRAQHDLLYSFDLGRWEEGTRLECLNRHSPLVQRLRAYTLGRGGVAVAYVPDPSPNAVYQPYLAARFHARFSTGTARTYIEWLGINLATDAPVKMKGDPLSSLDLAEGPPPNAVMPACETLERGIGRLADQWNRAIAHDTRELQATVERRYAQEAADIVATKHGQEKDLLLNRLRERLQISTECRLDMALLLWLPAGTPHPA